MTTDNESTNSDFLFNHQAAVKEMTTLYFKGVLSFSTILFMREIYSHVLQLEFNKKFPTKKQGKLVSLVPQIN